MERVGRATWTVQRRGSRETNEFNLSQTSLITLVTQRDINFVGEIPHSVRDDSVFALSSAEQLGHHRFLFLQFRDGFVDLLAAEIVDRKFLHNFPFAGA